MTRIITKKEYDELWQQALEKGNVNCFSDGFDSITEWNYQFGRRWRRELQVCPGLKVVIEDAESQRPLSLDFQHSESLPLELGFQVLCTDKVLTYPSFISLGGVKSKGSCEP